MRKTENRQIGTEMGNQVSYPAAPDPESSRNSRDCCCHVRTSMLVAAILMIVVSVVNFIGIFFFANSFLDIICCIVYLSAGIMAIVAIQTCQFQPNLLIGTIVLLAIALALDGIIIAMQLLGLGLVAKQLWEDNVFRMAAIAVAIVDTIAISVELWFMIVSVKCRNYLNARQDYLASLSGASLLPNRTDPITMSTEL